MKERASVFYGRFLAKALTLILLILVLGCAATPQAERGVTGVEIKEFRPDVDEVAAGNNAVLRLKVQNVGDAKAENVKAEIYSCGNLKVNGWTCPKEVAFKGALNGADISSNLPGEEYDTMFSVSTKDMQTIQNERVEQEIGLRLSYAYESSATATIPVFSNQRYKEREREGTLPETKIDTALAPLKVSIFAPEQATGTAPITLDIGLEKQIEGYVEDNACGEENKVGCIKSVKIEVSGKGLSKQAGKCANQDRMQLWRTGKRTFSCVLKPDCADECDAIVKVTAAYRYVTETFTRLTVKGLAGEEGVAVGVPEAPSCGTGETRSNFDVISLSKEKGSVSDQIKVTGVNFSKNDKDIRLYIEADRYFVENGKRMTALAQSSVPLAPISDDKGKQEAGSKGINPVEYTDASGEIYGRFEANFNIPHWIAMDNGAKVNVFAVGQVNKNRDPTASAGYTNCKKLEVEPNAKITVTPSEAQVGEGAKITVKGAHFPANQPFSLYFMNPQCADYMTQNPIMPATCARDIAASFLQQTQTDASGSFTNQFELNENFLYNGNTAAQGYKIPTGDYLVFATTAGINYNMSLNGAGELSILSGIADRDGDGVPDSQDGTCPNTPKGSIVCKPGDTSPECAGRTGCGKMSIYYLDGSMQALKVKSDQTTGSYAITYDESKKYNFSVKKNGVEATLTELKDTANLPLDTDILFIFRLSNTEKIDVTTPMNTYVQGIITDVDIPAEHCMGITLEAGKDIACAILPQKEKLFANKYPTKIKLKRVADLPGEQNEFIRDGFKFTLNAIPPD